MKVPFERVPGARRPLSQDDCCDESPAYVRQPCLGRGIVDDEFRESVDRHVSYWMKGSKTPQNAYWSPASIKEPENYGKEFWRLSPAFNDLKVANYKTLKQGSKPEPGRTRLSRGIKQAWSRNYGRRRRLSHCQSVSRVRKG